MSGVHGTEPQCCAHAVTLKFRDMGNTGSRLFTCAPAPRQPPKPSSPIVRTSEAWRESCMQGVEDLDSAHLRQLTADSVLRLTSSSSPDHDDHDGTREGKLLKQIAVHSYLLARKSKAFNTLVMRCAADGHVSDEPANSHPPPAAKMAGGAAEPPPLAPASTAGSQAPLAPPANAAGGGKPPQQLPAAAADGSERPQPPPASTAGGAAAQAVPASTPGGASGQAVPASTSSTTTSRGGGEPRFRFSVSIPDELLEAALAVVEYCYSDRLPDESYVVEAVPDSLTPLALVMQRWGVVGGIATCAYLLRKRGEAKRLWDDYKGALVDLDLADTLQPDDAFSLRNRGEVKRHLKDHLGALRDFDRADTLEPDHPFTLGRRGETKRALGHFESALADLQRASEMRQQKGWPEWV